MTDLRPPLDPIFKAFGVPATVTPPGGAPIATTVSWVNIREAFVPADGALQVTELRRRLVVRRDEVATLPRGTVVQAPGPAGGALQSWVVEQIDDLDDELLQAVVRKP